MIYCRVDAATVYLTDPKRAPGQTDQDLRPASAIPPINKMVYGTLHANQCNHVVAATLNHAKVYEGR
jgi:hypothetical protein